MFCQIWALGRAAKFETNKADGIEYVGAGSIARTGMPEPRPLTIAEIKEYVQLFATAAKNAVAAGFDGGEGSSLQDAQTICSNHLNSRGPCCQRLSCRPILPDYE